MLTTLLRQTFQETIYLRLEGSYNEWEVEVEASGSIERGRPEIEGLEVLSAQLATPTILPGGKGIRWDYEPRNTPRILDWLDSLVNHLYWSGEMDEGLLEKLVSESIRNG